MPEPERLAIARILTGAALVATGAAFAFLLPGPVIAAALLLMLLRICWLEDNIKSDLIGRRDLPPNHSNAHRRRRAAMRVLTGRDGAAVRGAPLVATAMRGQVQALGAVGLAALAVTVARAAEPGGAAAAMLFAFMLWAALRRADALVRTLSHLDAGRALPPGALAGSPGWAHSYRVDPED